MLNVEHTLHLLLKTISFKSAFLWISSGIPSFTPLVFQSPTDDCFLWLCKDTQTATGTSSHDSRSSRGTFLYSLLAFCGFFRLSAGVFGCACEDLRMTATGEEKKSPNWNRSRVLYIALFLCYRVNLRNLWQEVGQKQNYACAQSVETNKTVTRWKEKK